MPRSTFAYDCGRYAFMANRPLRINPYHSIDEAIDWSAGWKSESRAAAIYRAAICQMVN